MKRSFTRQILENTTEKTISFAVGLPDESYFPMKELTESALYALRNPKSLQYTKALGDNLLREHIADLYTQQGFPTNKDNILITSGSQQALYIISKHYNNKKITLEDPSYLGALNAFEMNHLKYENIPLSREGININFFENSIKRTKLCYLIPDFQNPTSVTYSKDNREKVSRLIQENQALLIEDAAYSYLYFEKPHNSISSKVPHHSYHLGSFSKVLAPGLRLGWIRADKSLLNPLIVYKETIDTHTDNLSQHIVANYLKDKKQFYNHLKKIRTNYFYKMSYFAEALDEILPEFQYDRPKGGMFIYGKIPDIDTFKLVQNCLERDVLFVPAVEFSKNKKFEDGIRFNFTYCTPKEVRQGLLIIKEEVESMLDSKK